MWRIFAWWHGPGMVDLLVKSVSREQLERQGIDAYLETDVDLPLAWKLKIAVERIPYARTPAELLQLMKLQLAFTAAAGLERMLRENPALALAPELLQFRSRYPEDPVLKMAKTMLKTAA